MPGESAFLYKLKFAIGVDEVKKYPAEVDEPRAEKIDKVLTEKILVVTKYSGGGTLKSGELAIQEKAGETFTLPSVATANQVIEIYCSTVASVKVKAQAGQKIYGDFINGVETITLTELQHVRLQSNGTAWDITSGEPKREQLYVEAGHSKAECEAGVEPSASRMAFVILASEEATGTKSVEVGGKLAGGFGEAAGEWTVSVMVPPGQKWKTVRKASSRTLLL